MLWIKSLHIISMTCWFAGIFYLPRLFVYHATTTDNISIERFKTMERRLYFGIMVPSMVATLVFGAWLTLLNWSYYQSAGWFHAKLALVFLLIGYHHVCGAYMKKFIRGDNTKSDRYYRIFNEIPVLFLVGIVILVVVKPF